jgi:hypothetical protein
LYGVVVATRYFAVPRYNSWLSRADDDDATEIKDEDDSDKVMTGTKQNPPAATQFCPLVTPLVPFVSTRVSYLHSCPQHVDMFQPAVSTAYKRFKNLEQLAGVS